MIIDRRQALLSMAACCLGFGLPKFQANKWFTHEELMYILKKIKGNDNQETINLAEEVYWNGGPISNYEKLHYGLVRRSNVMHRRILVTNESWWAVNSYQKNLGKLTIIKEDGNSRKT